MIERAHVPSHAEAFFIVVTASLPLRGWSVEGDAFHRVLRAEVRPALSGVVAVMMSGGDDCDGAAQCWHGEV